MAIIWATGFWKWKFSILSYWTTYCLASDALGLWLWPSPILYLKLWNSLGILRTTNSFSWATPHTFPILLLTHDVILTSFERYGRRMDVKTTFCAYWDVICVFMFLQLNQQQSSGKKQQHNKKKNISRSSSPTPSPSTSATTTNPPGLFCITS